MSKSQASLKIIQDIRNYEKQIIAVFTSFNSSEGELKSINDIISIRKHLEDKQTHKDIQVAAIHSLRRIFINSFEYFEKNNHSQKALALKSWVKMQFQGYLMLLQALVATGIEAFQVLCIRTLFEFTTKEHMLDENKQTFSPSFRFQTLRCIVLGLINSMEELSAEILLMIRDEIFSFSDCIFYCMCIMKDFIEETKISSSESINLESILRNCLDIIRMISIPDSDTDINLLVTEVNKDIEEDNNSDDESNAEEDDKPINLTKKRGQSSKLNSISKKVKVNVKENILSIKYYAKVFSQLWISFLAMKFNSKQHKIILKHISEYVIEYLPNPLLLADYLSRSYEVGGIVSIFALESLFILIVKYNLDYPEFFTSLYKMCNIETFHSKYRSKFMKLLSQCLTSSNIPLYIVASFIKKLARLSICDIPAPAIYYCIYQIILLLRKHPSCQVLIHRLKDDKDKMNSDLFNLNDIDLQNSQAMESSLWEFELLRKHHLNSISQIIETLMESPNMTSNDINTTYFDINEFMATNYYDLMTKEFELKNFNNRSALSHRLPTSIVNGIDNNGILGEIFQSNS